jgi:exopolysaccharide biosynthesis polyprenyl glycosylphosphotransferase
MLKEHQYVFSRLSMLADVILTAISVLVAHWLRNAVLARYFFPTIFQAPTHLSDYLWLFWMLPFIMIAFLAHNKYYASQRVRTFEQTFSAVAFSAFETAVAAMVISFFFSHSQGKPAHNDIIGENVSRGVILLVPIIITFLISFKSYVVRGVLTRLRKRGKNWRSLLLVGSGDALRSFIRLVQSHPIWGLHLCGIIDDSSREAKAVDNIPVVGGLNSIWSFLEQNPVDEVVFVPTRKSLEELAPYFEGLEEMGVRTRLSLNFFRQTIANPVLDCFENIPVITYSPTRPMGLSLLLKYTFDRVAALMLIILLSPVFVITFILVKMTSASWSDPVFYSQVRSGLNGKTFLRWKFRSMKINAEAELEELRRLNEMQGPVFKMREDPRITTVGRWIRKLSIDELPQLYNVLRGDMSLVGPRPPIPAEVEKYDRWQRRRLSMKPGITCLWQVMGRNQLSFDTWMKLDLEYIDNWSLLLDFKILCRTIYVVTTGYGAM